MGTTIGEAHPDSLILAEQLRGMEEGETVTYEALSANVGYDVQGKVGRGRLNTARRIVQREDQIVTDCERGVGIKRLAPSAIVQVVGGGFHKIHRAAGRQRLALSCVANGKYETLSDTDKVAWNASAALAGAIRVMTHAKRRKQLEGVVAASSGKGLSLTFSRTLAAFQANA